MLNVTKGTHSSRSIVVTGGTSGIGRAIVRRFAENGDDVVVVGRTPTTVAETAAELGARGEVCDVTSAESVEALVSRLPARIDVVVAMAGRNTDLGRVTDPSVSDLEDVSSAWEENLRANTVGTVLTVSALSPRLAAGGSVVAVSSIGAEYAATSYGASKAAVAAWTAGISATLGPRGVTVNSIAPGYVEDTAFFADTLTEERRAQLVAATHTGRASTPDDVAGLAFFLAGPDARQVTGQTIHVNGGAHVTR